MSRMGTSVRGVIGHRLTGSTRYLRSQKQAKCSPQQHRLLTCSLCNAHHLKSRETSEHGAVARFTASLRLHTFEKLVWVGM